MSRRLAPALALVVTLLGGVAAPARAQGVFSADMLPPRTALDRLGLHRQWYNAIPLGLGHEQVAGISLADGLIIAQTSESVVHAYDAETGRRLWSTRLGRRIAAAHPASANSWGVFVSGFEKLYALNRRTGAVVWGVTLDSTVSSGTAANEEFVVIAVVSSDPVNPGGRLVGYQLLEPEKSVFTPPPKEKAKDEPAATFEEPKTRKILGNPLRAFAISLTGRVLARPILTERMVVQGNTGGHLMAARIDPIQAVWRFTMGPIVADLNSIGHRTVLATSQDHVAYALDLFTGETRWTFATEAPFEQPPLTAFGDVLVLNRRGSLSRLDGQTGAARWTRPTAAVRLISASPGRIYLGAPYGDLLIADRNTGAVVADARATLNAGLNLRAFTLTLSNFENGRMYFATPSGMLICLREAGAEAAQPRPLRDPKGMKLGELPPEEEEGTAPSPVPLPAPGDEPPPAEPDAADQPS